jgi:hypothetical protein
LEVVREVWSRRDEDGRVKGERERRRESERLKPYLMSPGAVKRGFTEEDGDSMFFDSAEGFKRRAVERDVGGIGPATPVRATGRRRSEDMYGFENLEFERTVRGRLHWVGVMRDWKWEGNDLIF